MKKLLALFAVAVFTILVLLFITNPELLDKAWLWIIGFIGYLLILIEKGFKTVASAFKKSEETDQPLSQESISSFFNPNHDKKAKGEKIEEKILKIEKQLQAIPNNQPLLSGHNLTVLRYLDDGDTTLGLLFLGNKFFAYTLENSQQEEKAPGTKRISEGVYSLGFSRDQSSFTDSVSGRILKTKKSENERKGTKGNRQEESRTR
ncbi:MAG: DUF5675 family protein [Anditalea sp.]